MESIICGGGVEMGKLIGKEGMDRRIKNTCLTVQESNF